MPLEAVLYRELRGPLSEITNRRSLKRDKTADTGEFISETPTAIGRAHHDDYTVLIVGHFTHTDLQKPEWDLGN